MFDKNVLLKKTFFKCFQNVIDLDSLDLVYDYVVSKCFYNIFKVTIHYNITIIFAETF